MWKKNKCFFYFKKCFLDSNQTINTYEYHKNRYQIVLKCYNWVYCCHHLQRMIKFEANLAFGEPSCLNGKLYQD